MRLRLDAKQKKSRLQAKQWRRPQIISKRSVLSLRQKSAASQCQQERWRSRRRRSRPTQFSCGAVNHHHHPHKQQHNSNAKQVSEWVSWAHSVQLRIGQQKSCCCGWPLTFIRRLSDLFLYSFVVVVVVCLVEFVWSLFWWSESLKLKLNFSCTSNVTSWRASLGLLCFCFASNSSHNV